MAMVAPSPGGWYFYSLAGSPVPRNTLTENPPSTWPKPEGARLAAREWVRKVLEEESWRKT